MSACPATGANADAPQWEVEIIVNGNESLGSDSELRKGVGDRAAARIHESLRFH